MICEGAHLLKESLNCAAVADFFNERNFPVGPYARRKDWSGPIVRTFFGNTLLKGSPRRGSKHTVKHHGSGRRIAVTNPNGPTYYPAPHLAHLSVEEYDELNSMLDVKNAPYRRKKSNGFDPLFRRPRKRTRYPGQHACCWYCGRQLIWGGNGATENLICKGTRVWKCWNAVGVNGALAANRLVKVITSELYRLDGFDNQFTELIKTAAKDKSCALDTQWQELQRDEEALTRQKKNFTDAIAQFGPSEMLKTHLKELEQEENRLARNHYQLKRRQHNELTLPRSTSDLRHMLEEKFKLLAVDSFEFGDLMRLLAPEFDIYLVRLCDGAICCFGPE